MKRGFLAAGAAILVAAALAVPLWLAVGDDEGRRTGAISAGQGYSAELAIDGAAGGPFPVESFSWEAKAVGKGKPELGDFQIVRGADSKSSAWFSFAVGAQPTKAPATLVVKRTSQSTGLPETFLTYRLTDAAVRAYRSADDKTTPATQGDPPFDTIGLRYSAIEHVLAAKAGVKAAPGGVYQRMKVNTASADFVEILGYEFGFTHPLDEVSGLPTGRSSVDRLLVTRRLDDGLARWFGERATTGVTPPGTTVTVELRRTEQTGTVQTYVTYELKNAVVESVRDSRADDGVPLQKVEFAFDTLTATSADGSGCLSTSEFC